MSLARTVALTALSAVVSVMVFDLLGASRASAATPPPPPPSPGGAVLDVPRDETLLAQRGLRELRIYSGRLSGVYDQTTRNAVARFQAGYNALRMTTTPLRVDGVWDALTGQALAHALTMSRTTSRDNTTTPTTEVDAARPRPGGRSES